MAAKGGVRVPVVTTVDTKDLAKMTSALDTLKKKVDKQSSGFASLGKSLKGAFAAGAVIGLLKKSLDEAAQAYQVSQLTNTIIKNTGASAWTTAGHVNDLANNLSNLVGIDDELIQAGENVLLSFGNIRNAGKGAAAVFDRATKAAVDLSVRFGGDVSASAKTLGKALADPVGGMTALRKAGVLLTNSQKEQIKQMQKRGDLLGAQQIILSNVEGKFKGAAEATTTPMQKLQVMFNNLLETLGTPILAALGPIIDALRPVFVQLTPVISDIGLLLAYIVKQFTAGIKPVMPIIIQAFKDLMPAVKSLVALFMALLPVIQLQVPLIALFAKILGTVLPPVIKIVAKGLAFLVDQFHGLINLVAPFAKYFGKLGEPIIKVQTALDGMGKQLKDVADMSFDSSAADALSQQAMNYHVTAKQLQAGADATKAAGKAWTSATKSKAPTRKITAPKTIVKAPKTMASASAGSFTVGGTGGGISLSVTVNGSVMQERDIARTIRDELMQFGRRVGKPVALGV